MAIAVEMPKMSDTMEVGVVVSWLAKEGDAVSAGDVIAQVETDKATMDLEVYDDGVLLKRVTAEGDEVAIGGLIAVLGEKGEDISGILAKYSGDADSGDAGAEPAPDAGADAAEPTDAPSPAPSSDDTGRIKTSPLARKLASEHGIDLAKVSGSGPEGRIVKRDIEAAMEGGAAATAEPKAESKAAKPAAEPSRAAAPASGATAAAGTAPEVVKISQMRKTIGRRLAESKFTSPHFYLTIDVDMEKAVAFRDQINQASSAQDGPKISFNDLVTKACALGLRRHAWVNASWMEDKGEIHLHSEVHVAVAVAVDEGLLTPVIRHADRKGLGDIATETRTLALKARDRELQPEEWSGSTFTTSNLGMFGIEEFTAIINPPNACILAIGAIRDTPVVKNGGVVPGKRMKVTLSCDHRVVDGATGSEFLATVKGYLEDPLTMLL
ncbi:MAG: dihydrolipoamide acetyltransferase family protein [Rhodothermales bacterium]